MSSEEKRSHETTRSRMRSQGSNEGPAIIVALLVISSMLGILIALGEAVGDRRRTLANKHCGSGAEPTQMTIQCRRCRRCVGAAARPNWREHQFHVSTNSNAGGRISRAMIEKN